MENILKLIAQRRVWSGIVFVLTLIFSQIDVPVLTDLLTAFGGALSGLIMAGLALWSYFKPKQSE